MQLLTIALTSSQAKKVDLNFNLEKYKSIFYI